MGVVATPKLSFVGECITPPMNDDAAVALSLVLLFSSVSTTCEFVRDAWCEGGR